MKSQFIIGFSMIGYLGPLGRLKWTRVHTTLLEQIFQELSENHWENMLHPYFYTDATSLVNISAWE